jgi:hypothetical protein
LELGGWGSGIRAPGCGRFYSVANGGFQPSFLPSLTNAANSTESTTAVLRIKCCPRRWFYSATAGGFVIYCKLTHSEQLCGKSCFCFSTINGLCLHTCNWITKCMTNIVLSTATPDLGSTISPQPRVFASESSMSISTRGYEYEYQRGVRSYEA